MPLPFAQRAAEARLPPRQSATADRISSGDDPCIKWGSLTERERGMTAPGTGEFEQVVLPHLSAAYNVARWLVRDPTLAEDVVQDATLRALGYFGSYRGGDPRSWFLRIVRNVAYDALAARWRSGSTSLDDAGTTADGEAAAMQVADPADDPEAALASREGAARLEQSLAALPTELRECLVLRELEELSYKEIAHITGVPIGTVMSRLWRARRALLQSRHPLSSTTPDSRPILANHQQR
jgi:RNA polymerase sigma factor (sigma-70 family)